MSDRRPGAVLSIAVTLAVLLGLYVGAYYAIVGRVYNWYFTDDGQTVWIAEPAYPYTPRWVDPIFIPVHWLDRRIRPNVWAPGP